MVEPLDLIYHKQMLTLTQNPHFFVDNMIIQNAVCLNNPLCGDAVCFGYHQSKIHWHATGCLICLASAEALCQTLALCQNINEYQQRQEIKLICTQIQDYFNETYDILPEKFLPLSSVKQVKSRIKCVILSTQCVLNLIASL
jgi:NifU-like protein involved in Fe-S cluster formation